MKRTWILLLAILSLSAPVWAKLAYFPVDSSRYIWNAGLGLGVPYGVAGIEGSIGTDLISLQAGAGIVPLVWDPAVTATASLYLKKRYAAFRPKVSLSVSNIVATTIIQEESADDNLYEETYDGWAAFAGVEWRTSKSSPWIVDFNVGWVFPFVGMNEVKDRYNAVKDDLESLGYMFKNETQTFDYPRLSLGLMYAPKGKMALRRIP